VDKYLANYGFCWSPEIKIEFCPNDVDVTSVPPDKKGVNMHPLVLVLGLRLSMMKFIHSILIFNEIAPSQLSAVAWCTVLRFEALYDLYAELFSVVYLLRKTTLGAHYFIP